MKHVYRATRPTWAEMDRSETAMIFSASLLLALYGVVGGRFETWLLRRYGMEQNLLRDVWSVVDLFVLTFGCLLLIHYYKKLSVGRYPSTFLYCFVLPEASNPTGQSLVVGYCHVKPIIESGDIEAVGASFFWKSGQLDVESRVGFRSTQIRGSKEREETTCHIRYNIDDADCSKRLYRHGVLQFRLHDVNGLNGSKAGDIYAGYMQSTHRDAEIEDVEVRSRGYAEWHRQGPLDEDDVQTALRRRGDELFTRLQSMLRATPRPTLWEGTSEMESRQKNFWGHQIPTPQSVFLNQELKPYIEKLVTNMLSLCGVEQPAIESFKVLAKNAAILNADDTRVAYERALKRELIGQTKQWKLNETLLNRAEIIRGQITPFLEGDSLLDIGCGNGMIAYLVREKFKRIQLLDVVQYLSPWLGLPFAKYKDAERLPVNESFDTVLLLTVLHHSSNPLELLKLAWGATRKRLIIIESVVGVHKPEPGANYELLKASDENQIGYAAFVDWFYNRVLHDDIPVPYNFTTPEKWMSVFLEQNMTLVQTRHFGQDIDIGPEYHTLFVLQKE